jgi:hypothetical protein
VKIVGLKHAHLSDAIEQAMAKILNAILDGFSSRARAIAHLRCCYQRARIEKVTQSPSELLNEARPLVVADFPLGQSLIRQTFEIVSAVHPHQTGGRKYADCFN